MSVLDYTSTLPENLEYLLLDMKAVPDILYKLVNLDSRAIPPRIPRIF